MENTILITIICSLLDGLAGVVFAGVVIWIWQIKYTERKNKTNVLFERRCKEENIFYENFRIAKFKLYELFIALTNEHEEGAQECVDSFILSMQKCSNQINISHEALKKYELPMDNIFKKYNKFSDLWKETRAEMDTLSEKEKVYKNIELNKLKEELFLEIKKIDKLYFFEKL